MHQIGRFLAELACEVGRGAVNQWLQGAENGRQAELVGAWARQNSGAVAAFSVDVTGQILARCGVRNCSPELFLETASDVFGCLCEGVRFTVQEVLDVSAADAHMRAELLSNAEVATAFLRHADQVRENLNQGRITIDESEGG